MSRLLLAAVVSLGLSAVACQEDSPQQDAPPGIFTTTLGETTPTTALFPPAP